MTTPEEKRARRRLRRQLRKLRQQEKQSSAVTIAAQPDEQKHNLDLNTWTQMLAERLGVQISSEESWYFGLDLKQLIALHPDQAAQLISESFARLGLPRPQYIAILGSVLGVGPVPGRRSTVMETTRRLA